MSVLFCSRKWAKYRPRIDPHWTDLVWGIVELFVLAGSCRGLAAPQPTAYMATWLESNTIIKNNTEPSEPEHNTNTPPTTQMLWPGSGATAALASIHSPLHSLCLGKERWPRLHYSANPWLIFPGRTIQRRGTCLAVQYVGAVVSVLA